MNRIWGDFWWKGRLARACKATRSLCLTFDDGPGDRLTTRLLDMLRRADARATFFLLGRNAESRPEIVDSIIGQGHEAACHTHDHLNAWSHRPGRIAQDIDHGYRTLAPWVSDRGLFRPPYGKLTPLSLWNLRRRRAPVVMWTHDSGDTWAELPASADELADEILSDGGGVVLLHDFDRELDREQREGYVLRLTERLLHGAAAKGIRVRPVGAVLAGKRD